jgi:hypothetical protein
MNRIDVAPTRARSSILQRLANAVAEAFRATTPAVRESAFQVPSCEAFRLDLDGTLGFTPAVYGLDSLRHAPAIWHRGDLAVYRRYANGWAKAELEEAPTLAHRNGVVKKADFDRLWLDAA